VILQLPQVSARRIEMILTDYKQRQARELAEAATAGSPPETSCLDRPLSYYQEAAYA